MAVPEISLPSGGLPAIGPVTLDQELDRERSIVRAGMFGILIAAPFTIAITIGMMAIAMSGKEPWYIWVALGAVIGSYAALFFGSITATQLKAHLLDEADSGLAAHAAVEHREEAAAATG